MSRDYKRIIDNCSNTLSLKKKIDKLQRRFDYLFSNSLNPLEMREIGCRLIKLKQKYRELSTLASN